MARPNEVGTSISDDMLDRVDNVAADAGLDRADVIRMGLKDKVREMEDNGYG